MDALIVTRFVHIAATLLAAGTVWFAVLAAPLPPILAQRLRWLTWSALVVTVLSGTAWLVWLAADILGAPVSEVCLNGGAWTVLTGTRFGQVWMVRLAAALVLGVLIAVPGPRAAKTIAATLLAGLPALTGHAGALPGALGVGAIAADTVHLLAAAAWLGALPAFVLMLAAGRDQAIPVGRLTQRFARNALLCVAALMATGLINSWHLLAGPADLATTAYGRLLSAKLALFAAMLALAAVNRFHLTPRLPAARHALTRTTIAETVVGLAILAIIAVLGTTPPANHLHTTKGSIPSDAAFIHIHDVEAMAEVTVNPGRVGTVEITVRVMREDATEFHARDVQIAFEPPKDLARTTSMHVALRQNEGVWRASAALNDAGIWIVRVTITPDTGSAITLDAPINIAH